MSFNVIKVTSIILLNLSCLHLQNVKISDYMTIIRDPEEWKKETQILAFGGRPACQLPCHSLP